MREGMQSAVARGLGWVDDLRRDLQVALRGLRRAPGFATIAVVCLALGIGANAAIFSVIDAVLLRPLPYAEPGQLVRVKETRLSNPGFEGSVSVANYRDWRAQNRTLAELVATNGGSRNLQGVQEPERVRTLEATANLFAMLGVRPLLGRTFAADEDQPGHNRVAVLSEGFWRRRFGGDLQLIGHTILLDGERYTVIGVMPASFRFPASVDEELWLPYTPSPTAAESRGNHFLNVYGRLRPGVTVERADADLRRVAARLREQYPNDMANRTVVVRAMRDDMVGRLRSTLLVLFGAVGLVLLIACANVANLLLARAATRRHEVAVRLALGAGRARLVRQFLVESLLLSFVGTAIGLVLARWSLSAAQPLIERALPLQGAIPLDTRVFLFLLAAATACGILFGLLPALHASTTDVRANLSDSGMKATSTGGQQRVRNGLVVAEIALSLVLLVGAGLLMRGFLLLRATPSGLVADHVLTAHIAIPEGKYGADVAPRLLQPILARASQIAGVRSAAMISMLPIQNAWTNGSFAVVGRPTPTAGQEPIAEMRVTSPGFFATLGIPVLAGRDFVPQDGVPRSRVVIVNDALARKFFPGASAVGGQLRMADSVYTIVGVVGDVRQAGLDVPPLMEMHFPVTDTMMANGGGDMTIVLKTAVDPASVAPALRAAVRAVDPDQPIYLVRTMDEVIQHSLSGRQLDLWLLGIFASIALVLSAAGLYGVISYLVAQRTRELGIRMALGAQQEQVVALVMRRGSALIVVGIALGLLGALALTRLLQNLLYGVSARDPLTFGAIAALLAVVALVATYLPARRAARVDPLTAIRSE